MMIKRMNWFLLFLVLILAACAGQQAAEQDLSRVDTVQQGTENETPAINVKIHGATVVNDPVDTGQSSRTVSIDLEEKTEENENKKAKDTKPSEPVAHPFVATDPAKSVEAALKGRKFESAPGSKGSRQSVQRKNSGGSETGGSRHGFSPTSTATTSGTLAALHSGGTSGAEENNGALTGLASSDSEAYNLNFDDMDLHEVITAISDILGFNYTIDPRVAGKVTLMTKDKIAREDLFSVFETILKLNNATVIEKDGLYQIIPLTTAKQEYLPPRLADRKDLPDSDRFIFQIVPLKYIAAEEMVKIVKPFMSPQGSDAIAKDTVLIMLDSSANIKKLMSLIELFDVDVFDRLHVNLYETKYADAEEMAGELDEVFQSFELPATTARGGGITFVPITRLNMVLAISANQALVDKAIQWAARMDTEVSGSTEKIFVYYVQNGRANEIYDVLSQVFLGEAVAPTKKTEFQSKMRERRSPYERDNERQRGLNTERTRTSETEKKQPAQTAAARRSREATEREYRGGLSGLVDFVVDERNNAIITQASERDYRIIERTIRQLDVYPKQVLIEVYIAEIRLDDDLSLGVEWWYGNKVGDGAYRVDVTGVAPPPPTDDDGDGIPDPSTITGLASQIPAGLKYVIGDQEEFMAEFRAFASKGKANIISSPHVIATDNNEATIEITEEVPIQSGSVYTTGGSDYVTSETEYRDTGIILNVTPHINDKGLVSLEVSQEVSEISEKTLEQGTGNPIFLKRYAETTMTVQNGQTVILGGLIRETRSKAKSGVPFLSDIPILGYLFGFHNDTTARSELMLMLTPHVITSIQEADDITKEFRDKLSIMEDVREKPRVNGPPQK